MTLVRDDEVVDEAGTAAGARTPEAEPVPPRVRSPRSWKRLAVIAGLTLLVAFLTVELFAGPVERVWYRNRQSQLASDMDAPHPRVAAGQAAAVLQVPRLGINVVVVQGDSPERLRGGPGHRIGTAMPGARGNSVVVGHRSSWGGPFSALSRVRRRDLIAVQNRQKRTIVYRVTSVAEISGSDTRLLRSSKDHRLTLVTGRGGRFSDDRLVVTAISGTRARGSSGTQAVRAETPSQSVIFNLTLLTAVIAFGFAIGAVVYMRNRSGALALIVVVVPLVAVGLLFLLLDLDLLLPPLS